MTEIRDLEDVLYKEVRALYHAECLLINVLPKIHSEAADETLKSVLEDYLEETELHKERLEKVAKYLDIEPEHYGSTGMNGLIIERERLVDRDAFAESIDATLLATAQKILHYEIAGYTAAAAIAQQLGFFFVAELLDETLSEELEREAKLNEIAQQRVSYDSNASVAA